MLPLISSIAQSSSMEVPTEMYKNKRKFTAEDSLRYIRLYNTAIDLQHTQPDSALVLLHQAQDICLRTGYSYGEAACALAISKSYCREGAVQKALKILQEEQDLILSNSYIDHKVELNIRKGDCHNILGNRDTAIRYYLQALSLLQQHPEADPTGIHYGKACFSLGNLYTANRADFPLAIRYLEKVRTLALAKGNKNWLASALISLGSTYANKARPYMRPDSAGVDSGLINQQISGYRQGLAYFKQAQALGLEDSFPDLAKSVYQNISIVYNNLEVPDSAITYAKKALDFKMINPIEDKKANTKLFANLGAIYINSHSYTEAARYLEKARAYSLELHDQIQRVEIDKLFYQLYSKAAQPIKALYYLESYTFLRDSLVDAEKANAINELEVKYRTSEKDKLLTEKSFLLSRQQSHIKEKNLWIVISTLSVLLLAIFLVFLRRNHLHWRKRQQEQLLHWQQGEDIRNLKALIYGEEKERARIGQELHDGIIGQLAAAKINFTILRDKYPFLKPDFSEAISYLDDTAQELRKTAHNLMPGILIEQGLMAAINTYCEKISTFTGIQINVHQEGAVPSLDKDFELSIYRMVQELVQNIIKHANAVKALVQLDCHDSLLILTVEDNGRGMMESQVTDGTGLANMKTRVKALRGHMDITGSPGQGTSVYIELDISLIKRDRELCL